MWFQGPGDDARIVYIDGAFDLFHAGHVEVRYAFPLSLHVRAFKDSNDWFF